MKRSPTASRLRNLPKGTVSPNAVSDVLSAARQRLGEDLVRLVCARAELATMPNPDQPMDEAQAVRVHAALRQAEPERSAEVFRQAGFASAEAFIETYLSKKAQAMLSAAPWTMSAWLLGRWARQHVRAFAGQARFEMIRDLEIELWNNPFAAPHGTRDHPGCYWQEALFEGLFRDLVDPHLICREMTCVGQGDDACRFAFILNSG